MARILVVDDEAGIREMLSDALSLSGFEAASATDGFEALKQVRGQSFDLIVADVNMPRMDGYELLKRLRDSEIETPVILLTARHEKQDVATGFRVGADDYVTKPFGLEELMLRIRAILRRTLPPTGVEALEIGPVKLNDEKHEVTLNDQVVDLSPTEYRLLKFLVEHRGKVVRKETLLDAIWGMGFATGATVVDTYISYLRKKLHTDAWHGIKTVRGVGFLIDESGPIEASK